MVQAARDREASSLEQWGSQHQPVLKYVYQDAGMGLCYGHGSYSARQQQVALL